PTPGAPELHDVGHHWVRYRVRRGRRSVPTRRSSDLSIAPRNAKLFPRNVPLCSPGLHVSYSGLINVIAIGSPNPPMDLERQTISGSIPAGSKLKNVPVLPFPACTSSTMSKISKRLQISSIFCNHSKLAALIPPSP